MSNENKPTEQKQISDPINRTLSAGEKIVQNVADKVLPEKRSIPIAERYAKLSVEQKAQLEDIEERAFVNFVGSFDELETAIGLLRTGHHVGWKMLYMVHSKKTIRKYEEILDIKIRDLFPEKGPSAERSVGLAMAEKFTNFWKVVSGEIKIEDRRKID